MKLSSMIVDPKAIENGEWIKEIPECDDLEILSKGINCTAFKRARQAKIGTLPRDLRVNGVPPDVLERVTLQSVAETCILDWKNLTDEKGKAIPFSKEKIREIIADRRYEPLHNAFVFAANRVGDNRAADVEDAAKN